MSGRFTCKLRSAKVESGSRPLSPSARFYCEIDVISVVSACYPDRIRLVRFQTEEQREMVSHAQADFLFSKGDMENAARSYAATRVPFEEVRLTGLLLFPVHDFCWLLMQVALKFVNAGEKRALKDYVTIRLGSFKPEVLITLPFPHLSSPALTLVFLRTKFRRLCLGLG